MNNNNWVKLTRRLVQVLLSHLLIISMKPATTITSSHFALIIEQALQQSIREIPYANKEIKFELSLKELLSLPPKVHGAYTQGMQAGL